MLTSISDWAVQAGAIAILLIVAGDGLVPVLPGETAVIGGAVLAAGGQMSLTAVIVAGTVGAILGDSAAYGVGRLGGRGIRARLGRAVGPERIESAERMIARRGGPLLIVARFLPGLRIAINVSCGAGNMAYRRFVAFDAVGALLWTAQGALIAFAFGRVFAERPWIGVLIAVAVTVSVAGAIGLRERRDRARDASGSEVSEPVSPG